ncbi:hypothetical protein [Microscilla marina]|uniref:Uncharacterized protein n=1 Tax=Microscilla marina ATCC 23134 TaxID=313606 RepID=A1ZCW3_MICM2|nr:hypothetical protein [Microscilla marina]EAY31502.1 hypothetical protein M23134_05008 [Microscilla marina ATCC 23134]
MEKVFRSFGFVYALVSKTIENMGLILFYIALFYCVAVMFFWR